MYFSYGKKDSIYPTEPMTIKVKLIVMNFLQFFIWGGWLISLGGYLIERHDFTGTQVGSIYATMGLASLFVPSLLGALADRWVNAEKIYFACHFVGAILLFYAGILDRYNTMYWVMLLNSIFYMPTLALSNSISYTLLRRTNLDIVKQFPPIRVWGTVGFVAAMWVIDFGSWSTSPMQLYVSAGAALSLAIFSLSLPACPPTNVGKRKSWWARLGFDAFVLFKEKRIAVFLFFCMLLGAALQITNTFGEAFLHDFADEYPDSFAVQHPSLLMSISQISETLFILAIPFFLLRFGIRWVMLMSIVAWVLRFGLFAFGNPGSGFPLLVLSMIIYGMAFDFFNISGSLFMKQESDNRFTSSAQGLFMLMTNGAGAFFGATISGWVVDFFTEGNLRDWRSIWLTFSAYALLLAIIFPFVFRPKGRTTPNQRSMATE